MEIAKITKTRSISKGSSKTLSGIISGIKESRAVLTIAHQSVELARESYRLALNRILDYYNEILNDNPKAFVALSASLTLEKAYSREYPIRLYTDNRVDNIISLILVDITQSFSSKAYPTDKILSDAYYIRLTYQDLSLNSLIYFGKTLKEDSTIFKLDSAAVLSRLKKFYDNYKDYVEREQDAAHKAALGSDHYTRNGETIKLAEIEAIKTAHKRQQKESKTK